MVGETFWEKGEKVLLGFKVRARQDPNRKKLFIFTLGLWLNCLLWNIVLRKILKSYTFKKIKGFTCCNQAAKFAQLN